MKKVLIAAVFTPDLLDKIKAISADIELKQIRLSNNRWPEDTTTDADILYATSAVPRLDQAPNLHWVHSHFAGIDHLIETPLWDSDVYITNTSGIHAPNMAQYAITQILAWAHRVPTWLYYQHANKWPSQRWEKFMPDELNGRTLGIVGYGSIGREIARLAKPFGMRILVSKRDARHPEDQGYTLLGSGDPAGELPDRIYPSEATRPMLAECDYVVITLPLTSKTHHFFNEEVLKEMKENAFLINIGRGALVNEKDLVKALRKGWIAGAGLDVYEKEPLPESSPLWQLENVILTPHVAGFTPHYDERAVDLFIENLRRYVSGKPLLNLVNREEGY